MKITRILPRRLAIAWQEHVLKKLETNLEYHRMMVSWYEQLLLEADDELEQLRINA